MHALLARLYHLPNSEVERSPAQSPHEAGSIGKTGFDHPSPRTSKVNVKERDPAIEVIAAQALPSAASTSPVIPPQRQLQPANANSSDGKREWLQLTAEQKDSLIWLQQLASGEIIEEQFAKLIPQIEKWVKPSIFERVFPHNKVTKDSLLLLKEYALDNYITWKLLGDVDSSIEKEFEEYQTHLQKALDGDAESMHSVGTCYERGLGVRKNAGAACIWYSRAIQKGNLKPMAQLAFVLNYCPKEIFQKNESIWLPLIQKASSDGNTDALVALGACYEMKEDFQAAKYYSQAAEKGNILGQRFLAYLYNNGCGGVSKDQGKAEELYRKAASSQDLHSVYVLARFLYEKNGESQETLDLLGSAVLRGNFNAWNLLGCIYKKKHMEKEAEVCWLKAAEGRVGSAMFMLAEKYREENKTKEALSWYIRAELTYDYISDGGASPTHILWASAVRQNMICREEKLDPLRCFYIGWRYSLHKVVGDLTSWTVMMY